MYHIEVDFIFYFFIFIFIFLFFIFYFFIFLFIFYFFIFLFFYFYFLLYDDDLIILRIHVRRRGVTAIQNKRQSPTDFLIIVIMTIFLFFIFLFFIFVFFYFILWRRFDNEMSDLFGKSANKNSVLFVKKWVIY